MATVTSSYSNATVWCFLRCFEVPAHPSPYCTVKPYWLKTSPMDMILIPNLPKKPIPTVEHGMSCLQTTISCLSERPSDAQITNLMGFKSKNRPLNLMIDDHFHDFPYEIVIVYGYPGIPYLQRHPKYPEIKGHPVPCHFRRTHHLAISRISA